MDVFELGDVVCLKSGGPIMTVVDKREGFILCMWYSEDEKAMKTVDFIPESLKHIEEI